MDRVPPVTPPLYRQSPAGPSRALRGLRGISAVALSSRGDVLFVQQQRTVPQKQLMTFRFTADARSRVAF